MWAIISTVFLGLYALMSLYIGRRGRSILGKSAHRVYKIMYWSFFGILIVSFPIAEFGGNYLAGRGGLWLTLWGWYAMLTVAYIFMLLLLIDFVRLLDKPLRFIPTRIKEHQKTPLISGVLLLVVIALTLVYGTWNAQSPVVTDYELSVDKEIPALNQLRIAMVSDIHYGEIIGTERLERMVQMINKLQPDIILMAGDIIEGTVNPEEAKQLAQIFKQMSSTYGIVAVPGNHDRWARGESEVTRYFEEAGINVLKDEQLLVDNKFYIIGRDNPGRGEQGRKGLEGLMEGVDSALPVILLDHQPIDLKSAHDNKIDLQLSGHTHMGQIFPSNLITGRIYDLDWGLLKKDNYHLIVSSGYGTWGPPLRIGTHPEIVYIKMDFKN